MFYLKELGQIEEIYKIDAAYGRKIRSLDLSCRVSKALENNHITTIGELLLLSGGSYIHIPLIGKKSAAEILNQMKEQKIEVKRFCERSIYKYELSYRTTMDLIHHGIIVADQLLKLTTKDVYELFDRDYDKTVRYLREFRRHDVFLAPSENDRLLFEIPDLTDRIKTAIKINGLYTQSEILTNEESCLKIKYLNQHNIELIKKFIRKYEMELNE